MHMCVHMRAEICGSMCAEVCAGMCAEVWAEMCAIICDGACALPMCQDMHGYIEMRMRKSITFQPDASPVPSHVNRLVHTFSSVYVYGKGRFTCMYMCEVTRIRLNPLLRQALGPPSLKT